MEALSRARALTGAQAIEFDERLAELLTTDPLALVSVPALREAADHLVHEIDPVGAERRRRMAEEDRRVTFRPAEDGMAAAYALLTAHEGLELGVRVDEIAETVCESDPRTVAQRRADGLMMLVRGYVTLGCWCDLPGCPLRDARPVGGSDDDADGSRVVTRYRTLIHVVVNEKTLADPGNSDAAFLIGHGPIAAQYARDLAARDDAVLRPFGVEVPDTVDGEPEGAAAHVARGDAESNRGAGLSADRAGAASAPADGPAETDAECGEVTQADAVRVSQSGTEPPGETDDPEQQSALASVPPSRHPRAAWFHAAGVDLGRRVPASILLAARCCHADLSEPEDPFGFGAADPAAASAVSRPEFGPDAEISPPEPDPEPPGDESTATSEGTPLPSAARHTAATAPDATSPRALVIAQGSSGSGSPPT